MITRTIAAAIAANRDVIDAAREGWLEVRFDAEGVRLFLRKIDRRDLGHTRVAETA